MATFFIADRLRGIPLVTAKRNETINSNVGVNKTSRVEIQGEKPSVQGLLEVITDTGHQAQIERRHISDKSTTQDNLRLLFDPKAMTAATRRTFNSIVTTTTVKPPPSTTRKWRTTTKAPIKMKSYKIDMKSSKLVSTERPNPTKSSISIVSTTTHKPDMKMWSKSELTYMPTTTTTEAIIIKTLEQKLDVKNSTRQETARESRLTYLNKPSQLLSTQPLNQRRAPQSVSSPRFTNRLNDGGRGAGENWILFNRPDGGFSAFEIMVLASNIMIVGTIVLVLLMSWIKSMKKKRSTRGNNPNDSALNIIQMPKPSVVKQTDTISDRESKISMISSGISNFTSLITGESSNMSSSQADLQTNSLKTKDEETIKSSSPKNTSNLNTITENTLGASSSNQQQIVGSAQKMAAELRAGGLSMTNKAMAIVQQSESNPPAESAPMKDPEKLANAIKEELLAQSQRTINRSVSDLSKETSPAIEKLNKNVDKSINASSPNLTGDVNSAMTSTSTQKEKIIKNISSKLSISSLESIELPGELVDTIKKSGVRNPDHVEAPSPNVLLDEKVLDDKKMAKEEKVVETKTDASSDSRLKYQEKENVKNPVLHSIKQKTDSDRPDNPMGKDIEEEAQKPPDKNNKTNQETEVKNHQVLVNKLDKRKAKLEIVDLRDESVTGKMRGNANSKGLGSPANQLDVITDESAGNWISMDGLAVTQPAAPANPSSFAQSPTLALDKNQNQNQIMSPSEIIESRFHVDYSGTRQKARVLQQTDGQTRKQESMDSKQEEYILNDIDNELELDNKMKNRKYFVYIVNDGHFTAKKECIARIELPPKRRITLAELRHVIANSDDISLSSLRRNRFKFVTETYRLLNENEDAAVLHQVYPTQGVFLKLNIPEQENQVYAFKGRARNFSSSGSVPTSSISQATIASRRRATASRTGQPRSVIDGPLVAIDNNEEPKEVSSSLGRTRASSVGRRQLGAGARGPKSNPMTRRAKSSLQTGRRGTQQSDGRVGTTSSEKLPIIGRSNESLSRRQTQSSGTIKRRVVSKQEAGPKQSLGVAATDLGSNVLSGAKRLLNNFHL